MILQLRFAVEAISSTVYRLARNLFAYLVFKAFIHVCSAVIFACEAWMRHRASVDAGRHFRTLAGTSWSSRQLADDLTENSWEDTGQLPTRPSPIIDSQMSFGDFGSYTEA